MIQTCCHLSNQKLQAHFVFLWAKFRNKRVHHHTSLVILQIFLRTNLEFQTNGKKIKANLFPDHSDCSLVFVVCSCFDESPVALRFIFFDWKCLQMFSAGALFLTRSAPAVPLTRSPSIMKILERIQQDIVRELQLFNWSSVFLEL